MNFFLSFCAKSSRCLPRKRLAILSLLSYLIVVQCFLQSIIINTADARMGLMAKLKIFALLALAKKVHVVPFPFPVPIPIHIQDKEEYIYLDSMPQLMSYRPYHPPMSPYYPKVSRPNYYRRPSIGYSASESVSISVPPEHIPLRYGDRISSSKSPSPLSTPTLMGRPRDSSLYKMRKVVRTRPKEPESSMDLPLDSHHKQNQLDAEKSDNKRVNLKDIKIIFIPVKNLAGQQEKNNQAANPAIDTDMEQLGKEITKQINEENREQSNPAPSGSDDSLKSEKNDSILESDDQPLIDSPRHYHHDDSSNETLVEINEYTVDDIETSDQSSLDDHRQAQNHHQSKANVQVQPSDLEQYLASIRTTEVPTTEIQPTTPPPTPSSPISTPTSLPPSSPQTISFASLPPFSQSSMDDNLSSLQAKWLRQNSEVPRASYYRAPELKVMHKLKTSPEEQQKQEHWNQPRTIPSDYKIINKHQSMHLPLIRNEMISNFGSNSWTPFHNEPKSFGINHQDHLHSSRPQQIQFLYSVQHQSPSSSPSSTLTTTSISNQLPNEYPIIENFGLDSFRKFHLTQQQPPYLPRKPQHSLSSSSSQQSYSYVPAGPITTKWLQPKLLPITATDS
ncbi:hypothetical protein NH340_JMT06501 [Sarcoptes scabiei]|nr:hypothetical protein NH340_JMT06501 [Sarcoptes scabiei]